MIIVVTGSQADKYFSNLTRARRMGQEFSPFIASQLYEIAKQTTVLKAEKKGKECHVQCMAEDGKQYTVVLRDRQTAEEEGKEDQEDSNLFDLLIDIFTKCSPYWGHGPRMSRDEIIDKYSNKSIYDTYMERRNNSYPFKYWKPIINNFRGDQDEDD